MLNTRWQRLFDQLVDQRLDAVDRIRIDALTLQRIETIAAGVERHFALATTCRPSAPRRDRSRARW